MLNYCCDSEVGFEEMIKDYLAFRSERERLYSCKSTGIAGFYDDKLYAKKVVSADIKGSDEVAPTDAEGDIQCTLGCDDEIIDMKHAFSQKLKQLDAYAKQFMVNDDMLSADYTSTAVSPQRYPSSPAANVHGGKHCRLNALTAATLILCLKMFIKP